jgi:hypothetical protein
MMTSICYNHRQELRNQEKLDEMSNQHTADMRIAYSLVAKHVGKRLLAVSARKL